MGEVVVSWGTPPLPPPTGASIEYGQTVLLQPWGCVRNPVLLDMNLKVLRILIPRDEDETGLRSAGDFVLPEGACQTYRFSIRTLNESFFELILVYRDHEECIRLNLEEGFGALEFLPTEEDEDE